MTKIQEFMYRLLAILNDQLAEWSMPGMNPRCCNDDDYVGYAADGGLLFTVCYNSHFGSLLVGLRIGFHIGQYPVTTPEDMMIAGLNKKYGLPVKITKEDETFPDPGDVAKKLIDAALEFLKIRDKIPVIRAEIELESTKIFKKYYEELFP